jgi:hypothetical protein
MIELDKRLSKKEILKMYGIDRVTFEMWVKERGLPVIEVSTHSKYVRKSDLEKWESGLIQTEFHVTQKVPSCKNSIR